MFAMISIILRYITYGKIIISFIKKYKKNKEKEKNMYYFRCFFNMYSARISNLYQLFYNNIYCLLVINKINHLICFEYALKLLKNIYFSNIHNVKILNVHTK